MKTQLMKAMKTSISEVMETMFFLPVEPGETAAYPRAGQDQQEIMACRLTFSGDISGHVILAAPESLIQELAQNFMGEPEDQLTREHLSGTLKEMLNMICGNALRRIDVKTPFELGIPEIMDRSKIPCDSQWLMIETDTAGMALHLEMG
jgi:CheY-specific phosphatase CheX